MRSVVRAGADGVIVGSALVDALGSQGTDIDRFVSLCGALVGAAAEPPAEAA